MLYFLCMKKKLFFILAAFAVFFSIILSSCAGKPEEPQIEPEAPVVEESDLEEDNHEPEIEAEVIEVEEPEEIEYEEDDSVEILDIEEDSDDEYFRSIAALDETTTVTKQEFTDDKRDILEIISELAIIMETKDTLSWLNYIDEESKEYYKNPVNLRKAQRKLPNKLIELKTIEDYFKYVFIPARRNSQIDEIRYISKNHVKAVQIREDLPDAIYYEFRKQGDKWLIYIPPVE